MLVTRYVQAWLELLDDRAADLDPPSADSQVVPRATKEDIAQIALYLSPAMLNSFQEFNEAIKSFGDHADRDAKVDHLRYCGRATMERLRHELDPVTNPPFEGDLQLVAVPSPKPKTILGHFRRIGRPGRA